VNLGFLTDQIADIEKAAALGFDAVELLVSAFGDPREDDLDCRVVEHGGCPARRGFWVAVR
jgi:hypothetical protein